MAVAATALLAAMPAAADNITTIIVNEKHHGKGGGKKEKHNKGEEREKNAKGEQDRGEYSGQDTGNRSIVVLDGPNGKHERRDHDRREDDRGDHEGRSRYFSDQHRASLREYYVQEYRRGNCPPGLAKKNNGCMPPGQAKRYVIGRPLPREVIFYELPPRILVQLGPPPSHHKFVRVAEDILLLANGTGMVVDAIDNLSWELGH